LNIQITTPVEDQAVKAHRPLLRSMMRGLRCRCPNCGTGKLFASFSKSIDACANCSEELHHHRADDFPAYLVIFIVGHVVVAGYLAAEMMVQWNSWQHMALWMPVTLLMSLALLQPLKGAVIGLQWALHMHGFGGETDQVSGI
jgi:uncharacterized protein (DUF983 family)